MPREYDLRLLSKYDISRHRYRELKEFCLQHDEKKSKLNQIYTLSSAPSDVPVMGGLPGRPTENKALRVQQLKADIDLVEICLKEASPLINKAEAPQILQMNCSILPLIFQ